MSVHPDDRKITVTLTVGELRLIRETFTASSFPLHHLTTAQETVNKLIDIEILYGLTDATR